MFQYEVPDFGVQSFKLQSLGLNNTNFVTF
jgi:hypothetical protein